MPKHSASMLVCEYQYKKALAAINDALRPAQMQSRDTRLSDVDVIVYDRIISRLKAALRMLETATKDKGAS